MTAPSRQLIQPLATSPKFNRALDSLLGTPRPVRKLPAPRLEIAPTPIDLVFLNPPYGIFSRIARALGKSPSHVRKVALGRHVSQPVAEALMADVIQLKGWGSRASEPRPVPARLNPSIYRKKLTDGMYSRIARQLGIGRRHVSEIARGNRRSRRVEAAIKAEFDRINRSVAEFEQSISTRLSEVTP